MRPKKPGKAVQDAAKGNTARDTADGVKNATVVVCGLCMLIQRVRSPALRREAEKI